MAKNPKNMKPKSKPESSEPKDVGEMSVAELSAEIDSLTKLSTEENVTTNTLNRLNDCRSAFEILSRHKKELEAKAAETAPAPEPTKPVVE